MYYIWCIVALRMLLPFAPRQNLVGSLLADPSAAMRQLSALSAFTEDTAPAALPSDQVLNNAVSKAFPEKASGSVKDAAQKPDTLSAAVPAALDSAPPALAAEPVSAVLFTLWLATAVFLFLHKAAASRAFSESCMQLPMPSPHRKSPPVMLRSAGNCPCADLPGCWPVPKRIPPCWQVCFAPLLFCLPQKNRICAPWPAYSATS